MFLASCRLSAPLLTQQQLLLLLLLALALHWSVLVEPVQARRKETGLTTRPWPQRLQQQQVYLLTAHLLGSLASSLLARQLRNAPLLPPPPLLLTCHVSAAQQ